MFRYSCIHLLPLPPQEVAGASGELSIHVSAVLLIIKYGGSLTHAGRRQAEMLGADIRKSLYPDAGEGHGLLRPWR